MGLAIGSGMLRITTLAGRGEEACLLVEGRLTKQTVGELERECTFYLDRNEPVRLDLSRLTYADDAGSSALLRLERQGALLGERSSFLSWLLDKREEKRDA
jgi:ABC-type transporter Mla MlaB component